MNDYKKFQELMCKIMDINSTAALLSWDQEVYMPHNGAEYRAQQLSTIEGIGHEMFTSTDTGKLLKKLIKNKTLNVKQKLNVTKTIQDYKEDRKYPIKFVELMSKTVSESFSAWQQARKENKFSLLAPMLEKLVDMKRKECEIAGYKEHPYDALIDHFEPGCTVKELDVLFKEVRHKLSVLLKKITSAPQVDNSVLYKYYPKQKQWDLSIDLLKQMQYNFDGGRQDISAHPFTTSFNAKDVRITTRINENYLSDSIWSAIHEGGHALYEQGLLAEAYGLPEGEACSLGIHESQSGIWENNVGRSIAFCKANLSLFQRYFPENLSDVSSEDFFKAINQVKPSLIRTDADEISYHFHVLIRYDIEKALIEKNIEVNDLPEYWNQKYKEYLGVDVPSDDQGVLQDVHWSHGDFGYFPTYSLGSFYAAQFFYQATKEIPNLEKEIENGNMIPLLKWLREKIHVHGRLYTASELCMKITGEKLNFRYFLDYAEKKYSDVYNLDLKTAVVTKTE